MIGYNRLSISNALMTVIEAESEAGNDIKEDMVRIILALVTHLKKFEGKKRIEQLHKEMDKALIIDLHKNPETITCKKGCSHCCDMRVDIFDDEAVLMADIIRNNQVKINREEFKRQRSLGNKDFENSSRPCIFLRKNKCQIYESRPAACRKYYVTGNVLDCAFKAGPKKKVKILFLPYGEMVYSAMTNITPFRENATIAYMVNNALQGAL